MRDTSGSHQREAVNTKCFVLPHHSWCLAKNGNGHIFYISFYFTMFDYFM